MGTGGGQVPPRPDEAFQPAPAARGRWGRRALFIVGALILVLVAIAFGSGFVEGFKESVTRSSEPRSFSDHGLSFEIPAGLHRLDEEEREQVSITRLPGVPSPIGGAWFEAFVLDGSNLMLIFPDELGWVVDETNVAIHADAISSASEEISGDTVDIVPGTLAGFPSIEIAPHRVETPGGGQATQELVEAFDGNLGYGFICQYTGASEMAGLCHEVLDTVSIESVDHGRSGWTTLDSGRGHTIGIPPGWSEESPASSEAIHAVLFVADKEVPLAELQVFVEPIIGQPPPGRFVNDVIYRLEQAGFRLEDRKTVSLPSGASERLALRLGNTHLTLFALVEGSHGVTVGVLTFLDKTTMELFAPTAHAIAESLTIED